MHLQKIEEIPFNRVKSQFSVQKIATYCFLLALIPIFSFNVNVFYQEQLEETFVHSFSKPTEIHTNIATNALAAIQRRQAFHHQIRVPTPQFQTVTFAFFGNSVYQFGKSIYEIQRAVLSNTFSTHFFSFKRYLLYCVLIV